MREPAMDGLCPQGGDASILPCNPLDTDGLCPQGGDTADIPSVIQGMTSPPVSSREGQFREEAGSSPASPLLERKLPAAYGEDYIVLLTRDPAWLFAYWEITPAAWSRVRGGFQDDECRTVLRIYQMDDDGHLPQAHFDITVQPFSQAWHIQTGRIGGAYQAGIGIRTLDGTFREISRSNVVRAPRGTVSPLMDEEWLTIQEFRWISRHPQPGHSPMEWQRRRRGLITALGPYPTSPGVFSPPGKPGENPRSTELGPGYGP